MDLYDQMLVDLLWLMCDLMCFDVFVMFEVMVWLDGCVSDLWWIIDIVVFLIFEMFGFVYVVCVYLECVICDGMWIVVYDDSDGVLDWLDLVVWIVFYCIVQEVINNVGCYVCVVWIDVCIVQMLCLCVIVVDDGCGLFDDICWLCKWGGLLYMCICVQLIGVWLLVCLGCIGISVSVSLLKEQL